MNLPRIPNYTRRKRLGRGGFGEVWEAEAPGGGAVALKFVDLGREGGHFELKALKLLNTKNIGHAHLLDIHWIELFDGSGKRVSNPRQAEWLVIAMELADESLLDRLNRAVQGGLPGIPRDELLRHMSDIAEALDFLNSANDSQEEDFQEKPAIQHQDIKPQNLLLRGQSIKIADFGMAQALCHTFTTHHYGHTLPYAAPEFFDPHKPTVSDWSDQYSLAVTYFHLRVGYVPPRGSLDCGEETSIDDHPHLAKLSAEERPVLRKALASIPEHRWPDCRSFIKALDESIHGPLGILSERKSISQSLFQELAEFEYHIDGFASRLPLAEAADRFALIRRALEEEHLTITLFGGIKAGKSTLVNALVGGELSPMGINRATAVPIRISHGDRRQGVIIYRDSSRIPKPIPLDHLKHWMSDPGTSFEDVREVRITTDDFIIGFGRELQLLDTPGLGSTVAQDASYGGEELANAVVAILIYRYPETLTQTHAKLLEALATRNVKLFAVCNKDENFYGLASRNPKELSEFMLQQDGKLSKYGAERVKVDAYRAFEGNRNDNREALVASGFPDLEGQLKAYLQKRGVDVWRQRCIEMQHLIQDLRIDSGRRIGEIRGVVSEIQVKVENTKSQRDKLLSLGKDAEQTVKANEARFWRWAAWTAGAGAGGAAAVGGVLLYTGAAIAGGPIGISAAGAALAGNLVGWKQARGLNEAAYKAWCAFREEAMLSDLLPNGLRDEVRGLHEAASLQSMKVERLVAKVARVAHEKADRVIREQEAHPEYQEYYARREHDSKLEVHERVFRDLEKAIVDFLRRKEL